MRLEVLVSVQTSFVLLEMWSAKRLGLVLWVQVWAMHRVFGCNSLQRNLQNALSSKNCNYEIAQISGNLPRAPTSVWILQGRGKWRGRREWSCLGKIRLLKMPNTLTTILSKDQSRKSTWHEKTASGVAQRTTSLNTKNRKSLFTNPKSTNSSPRQKRGKGPAN